AVCAGQGLQLSASSSAGATYAWSGPNGFSSTLQNPLIPSATAAMSGDYTVIASLGTCASAPVTVTATVNPVPATPTVSNTGPVCAGSPLSFTVTNPMAGAVYNWKLPNGAAYSGAGAGTEVISIASSAALHHGNWSVQAVLNG